MNMSLRRSVLELWTLMAKAGRYDFPRDFVFMGIFLSLCSNFLNGIVHQVLGVSGG